MTVKLRIAVRNAQAAIKALRVLAEAGDAALRRLGA